MIDVIIPTCNRIEKLKRCISGVLETIKDPNIIIGDNSSENYPDIHCLCQEFGCRIINLRENHGNIGLTYVNLLKECENDYVLIVEDDDFPVNTELHSMIYEKYLLKPGNIVSFAFIHGKIGYLDQSFVFLDKDTQIRRIPGFWNGHFKFDTAYYDTRILRNTLNKWLNDDKVRCFDGSSDEAVFLMSLNECKRYIHINKYGMMMTSDESNESIGNPMMSMYSSRRYIDDIGEYLGMDGRWIEDFKRIQLRQLTDCMDISYDDVYNNQKVLDIEKKVVEMMDSGVHSSDIRKYIFSQMYNMFKDRIL